MRLRGESVELRTVSQSDQAIIASWRNKDHVMNGLFSYMPLSVAQQEQWFQSYLGRDDELLFVIEAEGGVPIGTIGLSQIDTRNRSAEYGRMLIGEVAFLRRGYAQDATLLLLRYAFENLGLHRVYLEVLSDNQAAIRLYKRCFFTVEARLHLSHFTRGKFRDVLLMAVLEDEYRIGMENRSYES